jgi:hypothetical protein
MIVPLRPRVRQEDESQRGVHTAERSHAALFDESDPPIAHTRLERRERVTHPW